MNDQQKGLYQKFNVERTDGSSASGGKHEHCEHFVLDLNHDKFAIPAIAAYVRACGDEFPRLAVDLQKKYLDDLEHDDQRCASDEPLTWCRDCQSYAASDQ